MVGLGTQHEAVQRHAHGTGTRQHAQLRWLWRQTNQCSEACVDDGRLSHATGTPSAVLCIDICFTRKALQIWDSGVQPAMHSVTQNTS
jgi:hypothetical protein